MRTFFSTESGSIYEINGNRVRRTPEPRFTFEHEASNALRGDGEWSELLQPCDTTLEEGHPAVMHILIPGYDNPVVRTTTPIVKIWHDDKENA